MALFSLLSAVYLGLYSAGINPYPFLLVLLWAAWGLVLGVPAWRRESAFGWKFLRAFSAVAVVGSVAAIGYMVGR